ncbi:phosphatidate cytidylyltransferase [Campylobacter sp. RM10532]|uniref:Phosphatidate cytidylyltransferase n=1 Tax=Campylobacter molothri TaxID=1032242 RepID=A0ACC5W0U6_9BACT|nr:phosphatidate cytidylyltransferase [Campylobacter sp. RM10542]MBZ7930107.1 phosphatidate cytidylyltransferase [Campylobacter sp. W0067]MBZ7940998.1 phosphatidate cytidylyltransferase [Campylobacter sp. W0047]MBZ7945575.1 phosphatidate cytidylyltransferase [Campylobacter sp. RM10532]MBZ7946781.1 phosphatidate cytidylyltransferase [Campylobacter sp. RM10536]MBZ7953144.1 phosphatidate cytidylyltransferase [Campylobacter sp. RM9939]MBZ7955546.1 phosphatidate cytidylyltransferase [Campylobacter
MFNSTRIIWGLLMVAAVIIIALIDQFFINFIIFGILLFLAFNEAKKLFNLEKISIIPLILAFILGTMMLKPLFLGILATLLILGYQVYKKSNLKPVLIYLYPSLPILALWQIYLTHGMFALFWLILIVASCDSAAYFIGKLIGKTPFSPTSPNKTLEGVIGGLIFASIFGSLIGIFVYGFWLSLFCSFFSAFMAVIGDLLESYFKREAGVKDSGDLIPGHGGLLDRIDAVIIAAFVMVSFL